MEINSTINKPNIILELEHIQLESELHEYLKSTFKLDDNPKGSWDYFNDLLAGYEFPTKIVIHGWSNFVQKLPKSAANLLIILQVNIDNQNFSRSNKTKIELE